MSNSPSIRTLTDEFNKKYAEHLEALFMEIGYAFVGQRSQVCRKEPQEKKRRFKLFHNWSAWGIDLWYGTSFFIPCELTGFPNEDDFTGYRTDTGDKNTRISLRVNLDNDREAKFEVKIYDRLELFSSSSRLTYWEYETFAEIEAVLLQLRDALL